MATEELGKMVEAYPMKGGDGPMAMPRNSSYQKGAAGAAQEVVNMEITEKLDVDSITLSNSNTFSIADLGCSVGPNTFSAVENIIDAVQLKYQNQGRRLNSQIPEFQVFFNDHTPNDFNILFKSLPPNRQYYATGVPGSFYGRLFPKASLHIVHSSLPFIGFQGYRNRAQEIVCGGLMVLIIPGRLQATHDSQSFRKMTHQLLGDCLMDLARKGVVTEEKQSCYRGTVSQQFGDEILDELFDLYRKKLEGNPSIFESMDANFFVTVLKRKAIDLRTNFGLFSCSCM
ncbi:hypothetical protein M0R45_000029 [Rubus argutus]|uniref:Uncharacterized protein n=1 Tax=Rubus argutus TaxID=59490 RepID=A0AAW1VQC0_RUBAR